MRKILRGQPNYINSVPKMLCKTGENLVLKKEEFGVLTTYNLLISFEAQYRLLANY